MASKLPRFQRWGVFSPKAEDGRRRQEQFVSDPVVGNVQVVRRRPSRRHRRNRLIRRWCAGAAIAVFIASASTMALRYLSPSLFQFQAQQSSPPTFQQAELSRRRLVELNKSLSQTAPSIARPVYPYSVVPGGVEDAKELKWVAEHDPIVAAHYAGFDYDHARVVRLTLARTAYVSYRIGNRVYWTHRRVTLHKGEKVITDGRITARSRCANRVEEVPQQAAAPNEPPVEKFDQPTHPGTGTAMQTPPVLFESALLNRPPGPGLGPVGPLSLYDPLVAGGWTPISPPPLPSGLCGPNKKKGTTETGCCVGGEGEGTGKKKPGGPCGSPGVVPEPGTWIMLASGLAAIFWQARRKLARA
jgi:PEP-CTERM motif